MRLWHVRRLESQVSGAVDRQRKWHKYANYADEVLRQRRYTTVSNVFLSLQGQEVF